MDPFLGTAKVEWDQRIWCARYARRIFAWIGLGGLEWYSWFIIVCVWFLSSWDWDIFCWDFLLLGRHNLIICGCDAVVCGCDTVCHDFLSWDWGGDGHFYLLTLVLIWLGPHDVSGIDLWCITNLK